MGRKHKDARHWIQDSTGQEIGPFIEEADARLCRAALELYAPEKGWTVFERAKGHPA